MISPNQMPRFEGGHSVLDLIASRRESRSEPLLRDDGAKLALVIEGGGMRGVVSGGMVTALEELQLRDVFDLVVGASAGALAGAYFLAGRAEMGTSIYYEDLIGPEWFAYRRLLSKSSMVAFDYLFDELIAKRKALDCERVLRSRIPLHVVATRVPEYKPVSLKNFRTDADLVSALRASARLPLIAGKPESLPCGEYIDGSLTEAIPVSSARELGATHMLVLLTRPEGQTRRSPGTLQRRIAFPAMNWMQRGLGDLCAERAPRYESELSLLEQLQTARKGPRALAVQLPPDAKTIGLLEQDPATLKDGAKAGAEAIKRALPVTRADRTLALVPG